MDSLEPTEPKEIIHALIESHGFFPNNSRFPLLIYKQAFHLTHESPQAIQNYLKKNHWINSWVDSIYDFHHYHSNTHEVLVIIAGHCEVQIGGDKGASYDISKGDVIIFPAGVSHKSLSASSDFKCIGAYPIDVAYDMNYGKAKEHPQVDRNIENVGLPDCDPIFGKNGLLFNYWK